MIHRPIRIQQVAQAMQRAPVTAILGPRQCGKSTLARQISRQIAAHYFDLENPSVVADFDNPMSRLQTLNGLVVIDEFQKRPALLNVLRVLVDRENNPCKFLILGSASPDIVKGASQSLAGRVAFVDMAGFTIDEVGVDRWQTLWNRGGFPRPFLADSDAQSFDMRNDFIQTFLERDIPQLGYALPAHTLRRFWMMLAHTHGQIWNGNEIGTSMGVAHTTARRYLDLLSGAFVTRILPPWYANVAKRQVKSPKVYVRDSGILHALLRIDSPINLASHPKMGSSFEGFCVEQILTRISDRDAYFWATHSHAELDLVIDRGTHRYGFEFKWTDTPSITRSMRIAMESLELAKLWVVYPGHDSFKLDTNIEALPITHLHRAIESLVRPS
jgi:uncharacterized protein